jgi:hypothetical protein
MRAEILNLESARWNEFADALSRKIYIPETKWRCDGDEGQAGAKARRYAIQIMTAMGDIDIPATLKYFDTHGGYCDCEILLNVDR